MNNTRGNNRRRGRGGNRQQGGGQQLNRIDSRARGNAPQLLEKYRKLAHDAHLNGDRVQEEYYLQFADHYFRVIADQRQRQEESRGPRRDDRWQDGGDYDRDYAETGSDAGGEPAAQSTDPGSADPGEFRQRDRDEVFTRGDTSQVEETTAEAGEDGPRSPYEPAHNPFTRGDRRDNRGESHGEGREGGRGLKPRRPRREAIDETAEETPSGFDASVLPPPISLPREEPAQAEPAPEAEAKPRRRTARKPKPPADDTGETLEAAN